MSIAEDLNDAMAPWLTDDLADYNNAVGWMFRSVEQWIDEDDEDLNWSNLLDPDASPVEALPYLAQYVGERLPLGLTEPFQREWIKDAPNQLRGTAYSIFRAAQRSLTGSRTVQIIERNPSATPNQLANPSFETDTSGWSTTTPVLNAGATLTRVTTQAEVGAASGQVVTTAATSGEGAAAVVPAITTFEQGRRYRASVWVKGNAGGEDLQLLFGAGDDSATAGLVATTSWQQFTVDWTPSADRDATTHGIVVRTNAAAAVTFFIDNASVVSLEDPDRISVYTFTTETPSSAQVLADLLTVVPADIVLDYEVRSGQSWADVATTYASWTSEASSNATWDQLAGAIVGTNAFSRPQPL